MIRFGKPWRRQRRWKHRHKRSCRQHRQEFPTGHALADVDPGRQVTVVGFSSHLPDHSKAHLQAYGLTPGYPIRVLQHSPVTIVQVENLELAIERELAELIQIAETN